MTVQLLIFVFFFFQAEDGIRDIGVTGVQTCALPICSRHSKSNYLRELRALNTPAPSTHAWASQAQESHYYPRARSLSSEVGSWPIPHLGAARARPLAQGTQAGSARWSCPPQHH